MNSRVPLDCSTHPVESEEHEVTDFDEWGSLRSCDNKYRSRSSLSVGLRPLCALTSRSMLGEVTGVPLPVS